MTVAQSGSGSGFGGWGLALFGLPFLGIGICLLGLLVKQSLGRQIPADVASASRLLLPFGVLLLGIGLALVANGILDHRAERRRARVLAQEPGRPWRADGRWAEGLVLDSRTGGRLAGLWTAAVFMAVVTGLFAFAVLAQRTPLYAWIFAGICALATLYLLGLGAHRTVRQARYGAPRLAMGEMPAVPGRTLTATVLSRRRVDAEGPFRITLRCTQTSTSGRSTTTATLHQATVEVPPDRDLSAERDGTAIHVEMPVPAGLPPITDPGASPWVRWTLSVEAATPGVDFRAEFDLPVFHVENGDLIEKRPPGGGDQPR